VKQVVSHASPGLDSWLTPPVPWLFGVVTSSSFPLSFPGPGSLSDFQLATTVVVAAPTAALSSLIKTSRYIPSDAKSDAAAKFFTNGARSTRTFILNDPALDLKRNSS